MKENVLGGKRSNCGFISSVALIAVVAVSLMLLSCSLPAKKLRSYLGLGEEEEEKEGEASTMCLFWQLGQGMKEKEIDKSMYDCMRRTPKKEEDEE